MINAESQQFLAAYPRLSEYCTVTPTVIRNEHWVIAKNSLSGELVRLHRSLWHAVLELDGSISLRDWIQHNGSVLGDRSLLSAAIRLSRAGIVSAQHTPDVPESLIAKIFVHHNPLMLKFVLFNPRNFLDRLCRLSRGISLKALLVLWLIVVFSAAYAVSVHWPVIKVQLYSSGNGGQLVLVALLYPLSKCLHELAHGWTLRRFGAQVKEAGITIMVLFPLPFVDATDAWTLSRPRRMLVTAAGMLVDIFVTGICILVWVTVSNGIISDAAFALATIGVVSVVFFNANPLLRFDGYYLLEDALDSPGLARRSSAYYRYIFKRFVLLMSNPQAPVLASGEKAWLLLYGASSTLYRFFIVSVICLYLITTLHEAGVLLSLFSVLPLIVLPACYFIKFLSTAAELESQRLRAVSMSVVLVCILAAVLFILPFPSSTRTQGVVWVSQQAEVYAAQDGQLNRLLVSNGELVDKGQVIMKLTSPDLMSELEKREAELRLAQLDLLKNQQSNPHLTRSANIAVQQAQAERDHARESVDGLVVRSPAAGRVAFSSTDIVPGINIDKGHLLAYVANEEKRVVRAVVKQISLGLVEQGVVSAGVRLQRDIANSMAAVVTQQVPSGNYSLPSEALVSNGLSGFEVHRDSENQALKTVDKIFHLELSVMESKHLMAQVPMGSRAYVTLHHPAEPLGLRLIRTSRQLLIRHLSV